MDNHIKETKAFFDKMAPDWDTYSINNPDGVKTIVSLANIEEQSKVVDIACGTGVLFKDILSKNPNELWGIDISDKMLEIAIKKHNDSRIHCLAVDFNDLCEYEFDTAIIYRAYPHFPDKKAFAKKLFSILKTGGRFIIAHNESRHKINQRHKEGAKHVSDILAPASYEILNFTDFFNIDIVADTDYLYIISGTKKLVDTPLQTI